MSNMMVIVDKDRIPVKVLTCRRTLAGFPIVFGSIVEVMVVWEKNGNRQDKKARIYTDVDKS